MNNENFERGRVIQQEFRSLKSMIFLVTPGDYEMLLKIYIKHCHFNTKIDFKMIMIKVL